MRAKTFMVVCNNLDRSVPSVGGTGVQTLTAVIHREKDMYVALCPEVGTISQGRTLEEAVKNLKEATELYLEEFPLEEKRKSFITTFDIASVVEA